eukprot:1230885-Amphidinium_carterae.1
MLAFIKAAKVDRHVLFTILELKGATAALPTTVQRAMFLDSDLRIFSMENFDSNFLSCLEITQGTWWEENHL